MELSANIKRAIRRYEQVETEGLKLFPIRVGEYELFNSARPALELMQQTLPVQYACMPLLSAYYRMDYDALTRGEGTIGLFGRALLFLALALRIGDGENAGERMKHFRIVCGENDPSQLIKIQFTVDGEERQNMTPVQFSRLRPILAAQNGIELVGESENPELIEAQKDLNERNAPKLDFDVQHLIESVCVLTGRDERDLDEWPILKLQNRRKALRRVLDYAICGICEGSGAKWKGGNPCPDPFFPRDEKKNDALIPLSGFLGSAGGGVQNRTEQ